MIYIQWHIIGTFYQQKSTYQNILNSSAMKTSIILSALVSVILSTSSVFASGVKGTESSSTPKVTSATTEQSATEAEAAYYEEIEAYYEANFEAGSETIATPVNNIVIYDVKGKKVTNYDAINKQELPNGAELVMTDGDTAYYIVLR
jgi:uncharacterized protein YxeA